MVASLAEACFNLPGGAYYSYNPWGGGGGGARGPTPTPCQVKQFMRAQAGMKAQGGWGKKK